MGIGLAAITGVFGYIAYMRHKYKDLGYYVAVQADGREQFVKNKSNWETWTLYLFIFICGNHLLLCSTIWYMSLLSLMVAKIYIKKITIVEKMFFFNFEKFAHVKKTALTYFVSLWMKNQLIYRKFGVSQLGGPE